MSRVLSSLIATRKPRRKDELGPEFRNKPQQHHSIHERLPIRIITRPAVPLDPGQPSVASLPDHVILSILNFLRQASPKDLPKVATISTSLCEMVRYVQTRTVQIKLVESDQMQKRLDWLSSRNLLRAVRVLELGGSKLIDFDQHEDGWDDIATSLAKTIRGMTGLLDLHWHVGSKQAVYNVDFPRPTTATIAIPRLILEQLNPIVRLHTSVTCEESPQFHLQVRECLARLMQNKNLVSLGVEILYKEWQECRKTATELRKVILSCPNLRYIPYFTISYPIDFPHGIWDGPLFGEPYCGIGFSKGEKPAALKELGMGRYFWGYEDKGLPLAVHAIGYPEKGFEWDYWANIFDWSELITLHDADPGFLAMIAPKLRSLKEVLFEKGSDGENSRLTIKLLEEIPSTLEVLSVNCWGHVGDRPSVVSKHGAELRKLKIHEPSSTENNRVVTDKELHELSNGLPHLLELDVDIARDEEHGEWPWSALDAIARFPSIRIVRLYFDFSDRTGPYLTFSAASQISAYLHERNKTIRHVEIGLRPVYHFLLPPSEIWTLNNSTSFLCERTMCVDPTESSFQITCPKMSDEMNAELKVLAGMPREEWAGIFEDITRYPLKVALEGPLRGEDWTRWQARLSQKANLRGKPKSNLKKFISKALRCIDL